MTKVIPTVIDVLQCNNQEVLAQWVDNLEHLNDELSNCLNKLCITKINSLISEQHDLFCIEFVRLAKAQMSPRHYEHLTGLTIQSLQKKENGYGIHGSHGTAVNNGKQETHLPGRQARKVFC